MKTMSKIFTTAMMTTALAATPVMAASLDADAGMGADISAESNTSTSATVGKDSALSTNNAANVDADGQSNLVVLIEDSATVASEIQTMTSAESVSVVQVDASADASGETVADAVNKNRAAIESLRTSLQANAALSGELEEQGVQIASVVAAETGANGSLTIYVR